MKVSSKDGSKMTTVIASPGQGPDRSTEVSYSDAKVSSFSSHDLCFFWLFVSPSSNMGDTKIGKNQLTNDGTRKATFYQPIDTNI